MSDIDFGPWSVDDLCHQLIFFAHRDPEIREKFQAILFELRKRALQEDR